MSRQEGMQPEAAVVDTTNSLVTLETLCLEQEWQVLRVCR